MVGFFFLLFFGVVGPVGVFFLGFFSFLDFFLESFFLVLPVKKDF